MRRTALVLALAAVAAACATPPIRLAPVFAVGTQRVYELTADATTTVDVPGAERVEHTRLMATTTVDVLSNDGAEARLRLTITPSTFVRDGADERRPEQQVELITAPDGTVRQIVSVGGLPASAASDAQDLAPLLGVPLPGERLHLGTRWDRTFEGLAGAPSRQNGLVRALRVEEGYDVVLLRIGTERPLTRSRTFGQATITLSGTEFSTSEVAFALREGFPVRIRAATEGRFRVEGAGASGGGVTITTRSTLRLVRAGPRAAASPEPS